MTNILVAISFFFLRGLTFKNTGYLATGKGQTLSPVHPKPEDVSNRNFHPKNQGIKGG